MRALLLLTVALLAVAPSARADDAAPLYDPAQVAVIDLTLSQEAQDALAADPGEYVDATLSLTQGDLAYGPATVEARLKGNFSFRPLGQKAAFKVKFPKANRLLGLKSITLNNMVQDLSMAHETLGYEILRASGVPAPRTGFAFVRVNGARYGLYLNLETYDDISLERLFGEDATRHLYEADASGVDLVDGAGAYEVDEGDEDDRADLEALIAAASATGSDWSDGMAATADLDEMTGLWAGEQFIGHWDGYSVLAGAKQPNNYYLHSDADGRFSMLATGIDQAFTRAEPLPGAGDGLLASGCRADPSCLAALQGRLGAVSAASDAIDAGARLDAVAATVARWRKCGDLEHATDAQWRTAVTGTRAFIRKQRTAVATYLGLPAPAPSPALASTAPPPLSTEHCPLDPPPQPEPEPEPTPTPEPTPEPPAEAASPPAQIAVAGATAAVIRPRGLTARIKRKGRRLTVRGALRLPSDVGRAGLCGGRVALRVKAGRRTLGARRVKLAWDCTYAATLRLVAPGRKLTVRVSFEGTDRLLPLQKVRRSVD